MIRTFLSILSASLLAIAVHAQDTTALRITAKDTARPKPVVIKKDTSFYKTSGGLRIGVDISRFALLYFQPYRTDVTIQADAQLNKNIYAALETGFNRTAHTDTAYSYKGSGAYVTLGVDYDFLKKREPSEKNMVYGGIRYGFARNTYEVPFYNIKNEYWGSNIQGFFPKTSITAHWIELVFGLRVEVLKNFFLGWGVREKILISSSADDATPPLVIPGFGNGKKKSQFDMTYTVSYYIPLYKVKLPFDMIKK
jgi:hypothetical protein